jgi:glucose/arabinose dehydrogenase
MAYVNHPTRSVRRYALARLNVFLLSALWACTPCFAADKPSAQAVASAPKVAVLSTALQSPWGMAFLPDGRMLVTQKAGTMVVVSADGGEVSAPFSTNLPALVAAGQGGLLDVVLDPDFDLATNPRVYWAFSESGPGGAGTAVARGNLVSSAAGFAIEALVTLGDRMRDDPANPTSAHAQSLSTSLGKVVRINRDGTVPAGNPNFGVPGALPELWSYGHRNPQGAAMKPGTDDLWLTEHGPRGGDELNRALPGRNYGWPLRSYGCPYREGKNQPDCWPGGGTHAPAFEEPQTLWAGNSTAPTDLMFYTGTRFDALGWRGNAFVGALAGTTLWRLVLSGDKVVSKEEVAPVKALRQRIRAVKQGPDGWIYLLTDSGQLLRVYR